MTDKEAVEQPPQGQSRADALKNWTMTLLTFVFVLLYIMAITGVIKPLPDEKMALRLEPIIFVIIGYYFGRLPGQDNEKGLKAEITRQTRKADAAQHAKEQAQQVSEAAEEKLKNVRAALASSASKSIVSRTESVNKENTVAGNDGQLRQTVAVALNIINS